MICISFMVRSSSLLPDADSISTDGRMHTGGTARCVMTMLSGLQRNARVSAHTVQYRRLTGLRLPWMSRRSQSSFEMRSSRPRTRMGFMSSMTLARCGRSWSLFFTASWNSDMNASSWSGRLLYLSCTIFMDDPARLTTPCGKSTGRQLRVEARRPAQHLTPWISPQWGQALCRLHRSSSFLNRARRTFTSVLGLRRRRRKWRLSSSGTMTRAQDLQTHCRMPTRCFT